MSKDTLEKILDGLILEIRDEIESAQNDNFLLRQDNEPTDYNDGYIDAMHYIDNVIKGIRIGLNAGSVKNG